MYSDNLKKANMLATIAFIVSITNEAVKLSLYKDTNAISIVLATIIEIAIFITVYNKSILDKKYTVYVMCAIHTTIVVTTMTNIASIITMVQGVLMTASITVCTVNPTIACIIMIIRQLMSITNNIVRGNNISGVDIICVIVLMIATVLYIRNKDKNNIYISKCVRTVIISCVVIAIFLVADNISESNSFHAITEIYLASLAVIPMFQIMAVASSTIAIADILTVSCIIKIITLYEIGYNFSAVSASILVSAIQDIILIMEIHILSTEIKKGMQS